MKALIFAAGKGTRLQPFTNSHPKALAMVNKVTLLERNILYLKSFGINQFVINIHHFGEQIVQFLKENNYFNSDIQISNEEDGLLETGGGLVFAKRFLDQEDDFLIMNADILTNLNISSFIEFHKRENNFVTLAVSDRSSSRKLLFDDNFRLKGWKNFSTQETRLSDMREEDLNALAFSGIHCINSKFFELIKRTGKFSIMDEYLDLMTQVNIKGYKHNATLIDVGKPESINEAEKLFT